MVSVEFSLQSMLPVASLDKQTNPSTFSPRSTPSVAVLGQHMITVCFLPAVGVRILLSANVLAAVDVICGGLTHRHAGVLLLNQRGLWQQSWIGKKIWQLLSCDRHSCIGVRPYAAASFTQLVFAGGIDVRGTVLYENHVRGAVP